MLYITHTILNINRKAYQAVYNILSSGLRSESEFSAKEATEVL
jgi:hypothetical protein